MKYFIPVFLLLLVFAACEKDDRTQAEKDEDLILEFLHLNDLEAEKHTSGLYYIVEEAGSDEHPLLTDTVEMHYYGYLATGSFFDASKQNEPLVYPLNELIQGWQIGVPLFGKGGKGKLLIPSELGYGPYGMGIIPANSVLIFDIELMDFWN